MIAVDNKPVVLTNKDMDKETFQWLVDNAPYPAAVCYCPRMLKDHFPWVHHKKDCHDWWAFWSIQTAVAALTTFGNVDLAVFEKVVEKLAFKYQEEGYKKAFDEILHSPDATFFAVSANDIIRKIDKSLPGPGILLYGGLEELPNEALESLYDYVMQKKHKNLVFKTFLNKSIWHGLKFTNKSHLTYKIIEIGDGDNYGK